MDETMSLPRWVRDRPTKACRLSAWGGKPHTIRRIGSDLYEIDKGYEKLTATGGGVLRNYPLDCPVIPVPDKPVPDKHGYFNIEGRR